MEKIRAYGFIRLEHQKLEDILEQFQKIQEVTHYSVVTGEYDGVIEIEVSSMNEIYELFKKIDKIEGIKDSTTHIIVKQFDFSNS